MDIKTIVCGLYAENAYLVAPEDREDCFIIDPGDDYAAITAAIRQSGRKLTDILLTHGHFDHMLTAKSLRDEFGARIIVSEEDEKMLTGEMNSQYRAENAELPFVPFTADVYYPEDDPITVCGTRFRVIRTPGHTGGSVCLYNEEEATLFSGDTLFAQGFGRTDMEGGSAMKLRRSLMTLLKMPGDIKVFSGHGEATDMQSIKRFFHMN